MPAGSGSRLLKAILIITHCVENLEREERAWVDWLGYRVVDHGRLGPDLCAVWNTPGARGLRYSTLQAGSAEPVFLRFIETGERGHDPPATRGWHATEILVQDPDDLARRLQGSPFVHLGGPGDLYPSANTPRAMQMLGPSGELLYFTRILPGGSRYGLKGARCYADRPFIVTIGSVDQAAMVRFYGNSMGLRIAEQMPYINTILADQCLVPRHTIFPAAIAPLPGRRFIVEIDGFPAQIAPRSTRPGHLPAGMAMVGFAVERLGNCALPFRAPPRALPDLPYAGRRAAVIEGPMGEWLELIEIAAPAIS